MPVLFHRDSPVAKVTPSPAGLNLIYDETWRASPEAFPVSLSMPMAEAAWPPEVVVPWVMNLLPEGEPMRAMQRALGVAQEDVLGLLSAAGGDVAGALRVGGPRAEQGDYRPLPTPDDLERIIGELPRKPFLAGDKGVTMSLAGAQDKLPVALLNGQIVIPLDGAPSTHILKPDNPRLPGSVQNEALCMLLAARCRLPTASVTTGRAGDRSYLLVDRYDRAGHAPAATRLHQEDFCQALRLPPGAKYERNQTGVRGPSLADMFALVRRHMTAVDITRLLDAVIFNIAIGNVDSHAKNYSILLTADGAALAPLYDLMSGLPWPGITQNHAQAVGGQVRGRHIQARHWRRMAEACGLAPAATVRRVIALTDRIQREIGAAAEAVAAMPAGGGAFLDGLMRNITERAALVGRNAARDDGGDDADGEGPAVRGEAFPSSSN
ncbi:type II toxin-antitoxin system HipA family toxin [Brevundimonas albigilva]|uniref:Type II toxin-antitoxin system HipA family toxin n=1 Tax=Brevundimonas albigilva TaxID=1312364 RepID=A0ABY4SJA5_9CAUL|nr:type II toxin-antitoxin system HipA family toxin [Brevundimonas albigilva]URI15057.1 type II toxin-antitoxin system HipA family toxin [Brevundimonas albigilva]